MLNWIEKYIMPTAVKIGNQRHLLAIRDALIGMIAITMVGSFAVLINNIGASTTQPDGTVTQIISWWEPMMKSVFGQYWKEPGSQVWWGTLACMTIFAVFGIANKLAKSYGDDGFEAMFVAAASYFVLVPQTVTVVVGKQSVDAWGNFGVGFFNGTALFAGLIISLLATELFVRLSRVKYLVIKLPEGVPTAVSRAFAKLFPGMITVFVFALFGVIIKHVTELDFNLWINKILVSPLSNAADSIGFAILIVFLIHLFWAFGLHGNNILGGIITPLMTKLGTENIDKFNGVTTSLKEYHVLAGSFLDAFVYMGGSGTTLGLLIALFFASKRRRQMVALGLPPGLFNINEPVTFGMPIVLNPIWLIPFMLTPIVLVITSYVSVATGLVFPVVTNIPWVTPPILGGWLATGGHLSGALLSAVNLVIAVFIYLPFVIMQERADKKAYEEAQASK